MTTSDSISDLATALAKAQGEMGGAVKDTVNPHFRHNYADLASVRDACREPLAKHGLAVVQFPKTSFIGDPQPYEWTSRSGETRYGVRVACVVSVVTRLTHASGQWMEDEVSTMLPTGDPQAVGSAITYLRRYALQSVACVAAEDDDGEAAHGRGQTNGRASKPVETPIPAGFDEWLTDLTAVADLGTPKLQEVWTRSKIEYRSHLTTTAQKTWETLKARAAQVRETVPA